MININQLVYPRGFIYLVMMQLAVTTAALLFFSSVDMFAVKMQVFENQIDPPFFKFFFLPISCDGAVI